MLKIFLLTFIFSTFAVAQQKSATLDWKLGSIKETCMLRIHANAEYFQNPDKFKQETHKAFEDTAKSLKLKLVNNTFQIIFEPTKVYLAFLIDAQSAKAHLSRSDVYCLPASKAVWVNTDVPQIETSKAMAAENLPGLLEKFKVKSPAGIRVILSTKNTKKYTAIIPVQ